MKNGYVSVDSLRRFWKPKIFERDSFRCRNCNSNHRLELAHVTPVKFFVKKYGNKGVQWSFAWDNLITLCHECHNCYHRSKRGFNLNGWKYRKVQEVNKLFSEIKKSRYNKYWEYVGVGVT